MEPFQPDNTGEPAPRTNLVLAGIFIGLLGLAAMFVADLWGRVPAQPVIPPVDHAVAAKLRRHGRGQRGHVRF